MNVCPHCKQEGQGFVILGQVGGSVSRFYSPDGILEETNLDKMYWKTKSTCVRCANCGKILHDYVFDGTRIIFPESTERR